MPLNLRSKRCGRTQIPKYPQSPATIAVPSPAKNQEFHFPLRDFTPDCQIGQLLRSYYPPSEAQLVEIRAHESYLSREIIILDILKAETEADIDRLEKEMTVLSRQIISIQRKFKRQSQLPLSKNLTLYELTLPLVKRTMELYKVIEVDIDEIDSLRIRRDKAYKRKCCASSILAPIRLLPPEIMGEIFFAYAFPFGSLEEGRSPMFLCQISSSWRLIAMTTPQLWTHLSSPWGISFEPFARLAIHYFKQAGELPLSLSIYSSTFLAANIECQVRELNFIWPRLTRLLMVETSHSHRLLKTILESATALQSIQFGSNIPDSSSYFARIQHLRHLAYISNNFRSEPTISLTQLISRFPVEQLTHLSIPRLPMGPNIWRELMRKCSNNLKRGSFTICDFAPSLGITRFQTTVFSALVSLKLCFRPSGSAIHPAAGIFFGPQPHPMANIPHHVPIVVPAAPFTMSIFQDFCFLSLQSLCVGGDQNPIFCGAEALANLRAPSIGAITFTNMIINPPDLLQFLGSLPTLQSLTAEALRMDHNPLLEHLSFKYNIDTFLPNLSLVSIKGIRGCDQAINPSAVLRMVETRMPSAKERVYAPGRCLVSVIFGFQGPPRSELRVQHKADFGSALPKLGQDF